jgi:hypothetical protein
MAHQQALEQEGELLLVPERIVQSHLAVPADEQQHRRDAAIMRIEMRHEGQRRRLRDLAALQQPVLRRDQRAERFFRHAAPEQDREGMHFACAADADVRWTSRHCHPGVIVDEYSSPVERDFLASVPGAQHGQPLGIERIVRDLRLHVQDCVAGIELPDHARIQVAAACQFLGPTENHPHTPPRS